MLEPPFLNPEDGPASGCINGAWKYGATCAGTPAFHAEEFHTYLPDLSVQDSNFIHSVEDLLKFMNNSTTRDAFEALPLPKFWSKMTESYL